MNQVIVYPNQIVKGEIVVVHPNINCGLTIEQIALKDVPSGVPYILVNNADIPTGTDAMYFAAWEADFSQPQGTGADYGCGSYYSVVGWNSDGTPILRKEEQIQ